jgi:hypothetical protein
VRADDRRGVTRRRVLARYARRRDDDDDDDDGVLRGLRGRCASRGSSPAKHERDDDDE